tara:strand:- start:1936 stop:3024 length:1089 start_codon:yes stop_codon:yes gene_type:complete
MQNKLVKRWGRPIKYFKNSIIYILSIISVSSSLILFYFLVNIKDQTSKDPGFAKATSVKNNELCHITSKLDDCTKNLAKDFKKNKKNILFLGNSQTGAINNFIEGDKTYLTIIKTDFNIDKFSEIKGIWFPNANFNEFEYIYNQLNQCDLRIDILFIPAFLDDTRENQIRESIVKNKFCYLLNNKTNVLLENRGNVKKLNQKIEKNISLLKTLNTINQNFRIDLYKIRNLIFNIKPYTERRIRISSYKENINSLNNIINNRYKQNLKTILYIPPLLNAGGKGPIPYYEMQYKKFKINMQKICKNNLKCTYFNLETLIPNKFWGLKESTNFINSDKELDYMHFTYEGHKLLAKELFGILSILK